MIPTHYRVTTINNRPSVTQRACAYHQNRLTSSVSAIKLSETVKKQNKQNKQNKENKTKQNNNSNNNNNNNKNKKKNKLDYT